MGSVIFLKNVRGYYIFLTSIEFMVPDKFAEAPFRTNLTSLGLQKLPVVPVQFAPTRQGPRLKFSGGLGDTLAGSGLALSFLVFSTKITSLCSFNFFLPFLSRLSTRIALSRSTFWLFIMLWRRLVLRGVTVAKTYMVQLADKV